MATEFKQICMKKGLMDKRLNCIKHQYTDKKEKKIFLIYKKTQTGSVAKSYD